jgi:kumamolisin
LLLGLSSTAWGGSAGAAHGPAQPVELLIGLHWQNEAELERLLREQSDAGSPQFRRYLSAEEFASRFAPPPGTLSVLADILGAHGLTVTHVSASGLFVTATGWADDILGLRAAVLGEIRQLTVDDRVYFNVVAQGGGAGAAASDEEGQSLRVPLQVSDGPRLMGPYRPSDIQRFYGLNRVYDKEFTGERSRHSTIAIASAFGFDRNDVGRFWSQNGIDRNPEDVELIWIGGESAETHIETTVDVEWAGALAPDAPILVYAARDASARLFLQMYDRIVSDNRAAVVTTSWGRCEGQLGHTYLDQAHRIFQRAAAQGITVIAASGDDGADDCGDGSSSVDFPASDPNVLAVGGTRLSSGGDGLLEVAWERSGGGVSGKWPAPLWQQAHARTGRVMADVAFNADPSVGFTAETNGQAAVYGGTSIGAPCWAAILAIANQYRAAMSRPPLGVAAAALCEVGEDAERGAASFRDVTNGDNGGFAAGPGWDFPTGWGAPRALGLLETLATWSPAALTNADIRRTAMLAPTSLDLPGSVRLQWLHRCARTVLRVQARDLPAGEYWLNFDGAAIASFQSDGVRPVVVELPAIDPRHHRIAVTDEGGSVLFESDLAATPLPPVRLRLPLTGSSVVESGSGMMLYASHRGRTRVVVHTTNLPPGQYGVRIGATTVGLFRVAEGSASGSLRYDSRAGVGGPLSLNPLCDAVSVTSRGVPILRAERPEVTGIACP